MIFRFRGLIMSRQTEKKKFAIYINSVLQEPKNKVKYYTLLNYRECITAGDIERAEILVEALIDKIIE